MTAPVAAAPRPVRAEGAFLRAERVAACLDALLARWLPPSWNPLAHAGAAANFALAVASGSGVALLLWYSPSVQFAYDSIAGLRGLGGWVRGVHRYSSDLAMLFAVWHALRTFLARKFSGNRWLPWLSGVGLIALVWFIGWTGCWLVWDQPAQQVAVSSMRLLDALPIFGEPLGRLYVADRTVPSLLFFVVFFLHMLLPLAIAVGLALHLARVSRARLFPARPAMVALGVGLALAALLLPAPLDARAQMAVNAPGFIVDAWYLAPLALALRFQHAGLWVALLGTTLAAAAIPWLVARRRPHVASQAFVEEARCHACTQCVQDCPFDAIVMVARTDGKRFAARALVDPAKCVGCGVCAGACDSEGIALPWFDTRREEARLAAEIGAVRAAGGPAWVAFVAADIDGGLARFSCVAWATRLPAFLVLAVPTASWLRPHFVEALLRDGVRGVLVVRDARSEAAARDGNRWVAARLAGERAPVFRPGRGNGAHAWRVVDFDPARPRELTRAAENFRRGSDAADARTHPLVPALAAAGLAALTLAAAIAPSRLRVTNPASPRPELVFSFRALGERAEHAAVDAAAEARKPIHMRGRPAGKPHRGPVVVRLTVDGVTEERAYRAKGISHDGPALDEWRRLLAPGRHAIALEVVTGAQSAPQRWTGVLTAEPRRRHVITFEPERGFQLE